MNNSDFELSSDLLDKLNRHVRELSRKFRESEMESVDEIIVAFEFSVPLGRAVKISVSGSEFFYLDDLM